MRAHKGRGNKYPWLDWLGRRETVIVRGVHYHCSQATMCQTVRNNASMRGLKTSVTDNGTDITIEVHSARINAGGELPVGCG